MEKITRDELQSDALQTLINNRRLILNWGTGVGKSRVAILSFSHIFETAALDVAFLLVVQETAHKENWHREFIKQLGNKAGEELFSKINVICYASLKNIVSTDWTFICFDEAHHLRSELRQDVLSTISSQYVLCLSATMSDRGDGDEMLRTLSASFGQFVQKTFTIKDAIANGILPKPDIYVSTVTMSDKAQERYDSLSDYFQERKTDYFKAKHEAGLSDDEENEATEELKSRWYSAGLRRKNFLGIVKTWKAKEIIEDFERRGLRYICFCSSVNQAEKLGSNNVLSSRLTKKQNAEIIEEFNSGRTNRLFAVGMLQEGQNLNNIQAGLIIQADGKGRNVIQKIGRVMRAESPEIHLICVPETRDEDYVSTALTDIRKEYLHGWPLQDDTPKQDADTQNTEIFEEKLAPVLVNDDAMLQTKDTLKTYGYIYGELLRVENARMGDREALCYIIINSAFNIKYKLFVEKRNSLSILMPLLSINSFNKDICIRPLCNNGYLNFKVSVGTRPTRSVVGWADVPFPKKGQSKYGEFIQFCIDSANTINKKISDNE